MFFHQLSDNAQAHSTYVLGDGSEAVVVDPGPNVSEYVELAAAEGARVRFVLETQPGDRVARDQLVEQCGAVALIPSGPDASGAPTIKLGALLRVGDVQITPLSAPVIGRGRRAYAISDLATSAAPFAMLGWTRDAGRELIAA
jgi:hydroxyacylglutathione hydrolase